MIADTKTVRRILKLADIRAQWTDKSRGNKDASVRIVVADGREEDYKIIKQMLADIGYTNKVKHTEGMYIRIKTYMA